MKQEKGYYRDKKIHDKLYEKLKEGYIKYVTKEMLQQCCHEYDTQVNEGMNTCIARYAPKTRHYSKSSSLKIRAHIGAAIYNVGYYYFWMKVLDKLEVDAPINLELHLVSHDRQKANKWIYEHNNYNKLKRKRETIEKMLT